MTEFLVYFLSVSSFAYCLIFNIQLGILEDYRYRISGKFNNVRVHGDFGQGEQNEIGRAAFMHHVGESLGFFLPKHADKAWKLPHRSQAISG
jgi:hypothetical protein